MYDESIEWLIYHPPKSVAFGHQSRVRNARIAWDTTKSFLEEFTQFELGNRCTLTCLTMDKSIDQTIMQQRIKTAHSLFGPEKINPQQHSVWDLSKRSLEAVVEFALDDDKYPMMRNGSTRLSFSYRFVWSKYWSPSAGKDNLAAFDGSRDCISVLGVTVGGRRVFLQPTFVFPSSWESPETRSFLKRIETAAPFRFRDQYFKRSLPAAKKKKYGRGKVYNLKKGWRTQDLRYPRAD